MPRDNRRAIRDPIHGLIRRYPDEIKLMNTAVFQRLRRIRQLALAHYVYPSALQSRFEHSVGTMHVAGRIGERLIELGDANEDTVRLVRISGLLHDIGHGPFSHVSEYLLDRFCDRDKVDDVGPTAKIHEHITTDIILENPEIAKILSKEAREEIAALIAGSGDKSFERDIVSSALDADKMDYLLRDSYFAGVEYGRFDIDQIIDVCRVHRSGQETFLAFEQQGIYAIEQLVLAKYHMSQQVYYHRIRAITDAMLVRGLGIAVEEGLEPIHNLYKYDGTPEFSANYIGYYDDQVVHLLSESSNDMVREIFTRLLNRRLLKEVCSFPIDEIEDTIQRDRLSRLQFESDQSKNMENVIAAELGAEVRLVIVTRQSIKNPTFRTPSYQLAEEEIIVIDRNGTPRTIGDYPDLTFNLNTRASSRETLQVFAPRDEWTDAEDNEDQRAQLREKIQDLVLSVA